MDINREFEALKHLLKKERKAREVTEELLETKTLELYESKKSEIKKIKLVEKSKREQDNLTMTTLIINLLEEKIKISKKQNKLLLDKEEKYLGILNSALDVICLVEGSGEINTINNTGLNLFGYSKTMALGKKIDDLIPDIGNDISRFIGNKDSLTDVKCTCVRSNGSKFPAEIYISLVKLENTIMYCFVIHDISKKERAELCLKTIRKVQEMYISGLDKKIIYEYILSFLIDFTNSEYGFIGEILVKDNAPYLKTTAITNIALDDNTRDFFTQHHQDGIQFHNLNTLIEYTIKTGDPVVFNDPKHAPRSGGVPKGYPKLNSYIGVPIQGSEGMVAMFGLANCKTGYNKYLLQELSSLSSVISAIIKSIRSFALIEEMANKDSLTGTYNRFYFKSFIKDLIKKRNYDKAKMFCIMMIDLNDFKNVNDYYGHESGDFILKEFSKRAMSCIKKSDIIARVGGDEFVIIVEDLVKYSYAGKIAERIIGLSKKPYFINEKNIKASVSIGIACYPISGDSIDLLLRNSDLALYKAKNINNKYCYFSKEIQEVYLREKELENYIKSSFNDGLLDIVIQPQIDIQTGGVTGGEVLLRVRGKNSSYLPENFIKTIEKIGMADRLNEYVVKRAIEYINQQTFSHGQIISLNISTKVVDMISHFSLLANMVTEDCTNDNVQFCFELTEKSLVETQKCMVKYSSIDKLLKQKNILLSIDDFGVEYSSISRLFEFDFSSIKIDMSFVKMLESEQAELGYTVIKSVVAIAKSLPAIVVAEGVETEYQYKILREIGCDKIQGNYFYKPMNPDEFTALM